MGRVAAGLPGVVIPPEARRQRLDLAQVLAEHGPTPCEDGEPAMWWPPASGSSADAVSGCEVCPATVECLAYAVAADDREGVWGGLTRAERLGLTRAPAA